MHVHDTLKVSERRACKVLGQYRSTQSHRHRIYDEEEQLTNRIVELATTHRRYGYRLITGLLRNEGWKVNHKRVERIWRKEGLKVPKKQPKRGRLYEFTRECLDITVERKIISHLVIERLADQGYTRTYTLR
jgi:transposase InsO family protein